MKKAGSNHGVLFHVTERIITQFDLKSIYRRWFTVCSVLKSVILFLKKFCEKKKMTLHKNIDKR